MKTRPFSDLTKDLSPQRRKRIEAKKAKMRAAMALHDMRRARAMTQKALGETLHVNQPAVAKMERRRDMYVSNLRAYIEAMGGRLRIVADFPEGEIEVTGVGEGGEE